MADLGEIAGLPAAAAEALRRGHGIATVEKLWERLAKPDFRNELAAIADTAGMPVAEFRAILADDAARRSLDQGPFVESMFATAGHTGHVRRHLPDVVVIASLLALLVAFWLASVRVPAARQGLVASAVVPAGWVLRDDDLAIAEVRGGEGLTSAAAAVGRVALQPLAAGELVREHGLGPPVPTTSTVVHLPLAVKGTALRPGETVSLVVPVGEEERVVVDRALVLRVEAEAATFALEASASAILGRMAHDARVIAFRPPVR